MAFTLALLNKNAYVINKTLNKFIKSLKIWLGDINKIGIKRSVSVADLRKWVCVSGGQWRFIWQSDIWVSPAWSKGESRQMAGEEHPCQEQRRCKGPEARESGSMLTYLTNCKRHNMPGEEGEGKGQGQLTEDLVGHGKEFRFYSETDLSWVWFFSWKSWEISLAPVSFVKNCPFPELHMVRNC